MTDQPEPAAWTPPPPGDRREQLPDHILAAIRPTPYLSTACHAAFLCETTEPTEALTGWPERLHARCRLQNKFTGKPCVCRCHGSAAVNEAGDLTGYLAPDPPIGCLTVAAERTPSQRPDLHAQLADAIRTAACDGDCGKAEDECARQHIQPVVSHHGRLAEVSGSPEQFADVALTLLYREWPWLRAAAEDATPPAAT